MFLYVIPLNTKVRTDFFVWTHQKSVFLILEYLTIKDFPRPFQSLY